MAILFEDNFTGGIKSKWEIISGSQGEVILESWEHNSELDAIQSAYDDKNIIIVNTTTPDDMLVETKLISLSSEYSYFDLLTRHSITYAGIYSRNWGYSIAYLEVYGRLYDTPLFLIRWDEGVRAVYMAEITWADLGLSGVADLIGKTLGIRCEGNVIKGYLDGVEILSVIDDTYISGQTGLLAAPKPDTESFIFDNFKIVEQTFEEKVLNNLGIIKEELEEIKEKTEARLGS